LGLSQSIGAARDFEGVGGWRIGDREDEEALWTSINSRLELPAEHKRRHQRSHTSGSLPIVGMKGSRSPEELMNTSRTRSRTPPTSGFGDGYFAQGGISPRALLRSPSVSTGNSGSSGSSKGSFMLSMNQKC